MTKGISVDLDFSPSWFFSILNDQKTPGIGSQENANAKIEAFGRRPSDSSSYFASLTTGILEPWNNGLWKRHQPGAIRSLISNNRRISETFNYNAQLPKGFFVKRHINYGPEACETASKNVCPNGFRRGVELRPLVMRTPG